MASSGEKTGSTNAERNFSTSFEPIVEAFAAGKTAGRLVFTLLPLQPLDVLAVTIDFGLVAIDLLLLAVISVLLTLQLVADQRAGA